jgi:hypothetical protein
MSSMNNRMIYLSNDALPGLAPHGRRSDRARSAPSKAKVRDFLPAGALLIVGLGVLAIATLSPSGRHGQYAVIAPPWYSLAQTISLVRAANGGIVDVGNPGNMVIAFSDKPDFVRALYRAGAWLVIDPMRLRGCLGFRPTNESFSQ